MGCDIHLHLEAKINGRWEHAGEFQDTWRCYHFFSFLAECGRGGGQSPLIENRGLPANINPFTAQDLEYEHSCSWLTEEEFQNAHKAASVGYPEIQPLHDLQKEALGIYAEDMELRYVFGFDN